MCAYLSADLQSKGRKQDDDLETPLFLKFILDFHGKGQMGKQAIALMG